MSSKKTYKRPIRHEKMFKFSSHQVNAKQNHTEMSLQGARTAVTKDSDLMECQTHPEVGALETEKQGAHIADENVRSCCHGVRGGGGGVLSGLSV